MPSYASRYSDYARRVIKGVFQNEPDFVTWLVPKYPMLTKPVHQKYHELSCSQKEIEYQNSVSVFYSIDCATNQDDVVNYPPEFLNSLDLPGLPPHNLQLKVGSIVIMLRNINPPRLSTILKGKYKGEVLIPRIPMIPTDVPFQF
ncbi:hypothetical protein K1T71_014972 [Dendrolimus kikuchii]|nr:hypothetical protein K1T71_014972 [Dendrolimus kikuchii]